MNKVISVCWREECVSLFKCGCVCVRTLTDVKGVAAGDEHCSYT